MKLSKKLALSTCLVSFVGLTSTAFANGMPAGVDCCADLETRVKRLEDKAVEGTTKKLYVSGSLNRAVAWIDDGKQANTSHVDNYNYTSRITVEGQADYNEDISFGLRLTLMPTTHSTLNTVPHNAPTASNAETRLTVRESEVFMKSNKFGTLTAGHGNFASFYSFYSTNLSGVFNHIEPYIMDSSTPFRNKATGATSTATFPTLLPVTIFQPGSTVNLQTRGDRIMYWTPTWYGLTLGGSHGYHNRGDLWDVTARFAGKFGGWIVAAGTSFARNHSREAIDSGAVGTLAGQGVTYDQINATVGALAPFSFTGKDGAGIYGRFAWSKRDYDRVRNKDGRVVRGTLGYKDMFTDMGMTSIEGTYGQYKNMTLMPNPTQTVVGKSWTVGVQQNIDAVGSELYASYTNQKLNIKNVAVKWADQDVVLVGARVKF